MKTGFALLCATAIAIEASGCGGTTAVESHDPLPDEWMEQPATSASDAPLRKPCPSPELRSAVALCLQSEAQGKEERTNLKFHLLTLFDLSARVEGKRMECRVGNLFACVGEPCPVQQGVICMLGKSAYRPYMDMLLQQKMAKSLKEWPKPDEIDRAISQCVFYSVLRFAQTMSALHQVGFSGRKMESDAKFAAARRDTLNTAIDLGSHLVNRYPTYPAKDRVLFTVGYLNDRMVDFDQTADNTKRRGFVESAEKQYETLLRDFPDSQYVRLVGIARAERTLRDDSNDSGNDSSFAAALELASSSPRLAVYVRYLAAWKALKRGDASIAWKEMITLASSQPPVEQPIDCAVSEFAQTDSVHAFVETQDAENAAAAYSALPAERAALALSLLTGEYVRRGRCTEAKTVFEQLTSESCKQ